MATANFKYQDDFDLWAADFSLPIYADDDDENAAPVDYLFDDYNYNLADDEIQKVNDGLKFFKLRLEDGYYAGTQIVIDDNDCPDEWWFEHCFDFAEYGVNSYILRRMITAEKRRINDKILPLFREYGFDHYGISARFSNGETWYSKVA